MWQSHLPHFFLRTGLKYDLKRVEEVLYDVKIRGLLKAKQEQSFAPTEMEAWLDAAIYSTLRRQMLWSLLRIGRGECEVDGDDVDGDILNMEEVGIHSEVIWLL